MSSMLFVMPTSAVGGGNVKIIHYLSHARSLGLRVGLWVTQDNDPINWSPQSVADIHIRTPETLKEWDTIFFTWAPDWPKISERLTSPLSEQHIIHIIQHIRHINPDFLNGYALHLLQTKAFSRICVSPEVAETITPYVKNTALMKTIPNVIDTRLFHPTFRWITPSRPLKVLYANWKTTFGNRIRDYWQSTHARDTIIFESIDHPLSQQAFAHRMRAADIFIGTPNKTEGFYLAPLEAMASAVAVICPDVIGNRSFCLRNVTCLMPVYDDLDGHVSTLRQFLDDPNLRHTIARNGYQKARSRQWWDERGDFLCFLQRLTPISSTTSHCDENVATTVTSHETMANLRD
ncbi:MAG: hypothetical protein CMH81_04875 [Nitrospiraceae bacterium]|nr:hypothetical protein [Nitrospiraceae bacterium]